MNKSKRLAGANKVLSETILIHITKSTTVDKYISMSENWSFLHLQCC